MNKREAREKIMKAVRPRLGPEGDIAVTAIAGRFPGAPSPLALWASVAAGKELIVAYSYDELIKAGVEPGQLDEFYVARGAFISDTNLFDYGFFQISPREALRMDPQQRVFLEVCHEALELSGYCRGSDAGITSLFVGTRKSTWEPYASALSTSQATDAMLVLSGNSADAFATRVAYKLDCIGPAVNVSTFCSGSLVAVHMACQSLLCGESDMAIAGGACIRFPEHVGYRYYRGGILSPTGRVHAFDAAANGTIFADALAAIVLRRLEDAQRMGDPILAVIKGSAVNNDGAARAGYSTPSVEGQSNVIYQAFAQAKVSPEQVGMIEAHGTGTPIGDGIELRALHRVFAGSKNSFCGLGSIKTNVGHADCASGITGLVKAIYAVHFGVIPPTLNYSRPNLEFDEKQSPFFIPLTLRTWDPGLLPRIAGVSSFGIGGTNAHVVIYEPPKAMRSGPTKETAHLIPISARSSRELDRIAAEIRVLLTKSPDINLADLAFTLQKGRRAHSVRRIIIASDIQKLIAGLNSSQGFTVACERNLEDYYLNVAKDWQEGHSVDWNIFYQGEKRKRLALPPYPFKRSPLFI